MVDSTEHAAKLVNDEEERMHRLVDEAEKQLPTHSRQATKMTREEQRQDYQTTKYTPGALQQRLREMKEQFGLVRAVDYLLDWSRDNE